MTIAVVSLKHKPFTMQHGTSTDSRRGQIQRETSQSKPFLTKMWWIAGVPNRSLFYGFSRIRDHIICLTVKDIFVNYLVFLPRLMGVPVAGNAGHRAHGNFVQR
jgi:hypothetical protein